MSRNQADSHADSALALAVWAMGARFELLLAGLEERHLRAAGEAAVEEIERAHHRLNRFARGSLVARINTAAPTQAVPVDAELLGLLREAERIRVQSGGAFDCTPASPVKPGVRIDETSATVTRLHADATIDLGGIAKGHAVDLAIEALREAGVPSAFVQGGRSACAAFGNRPDGTPWSVLLEPPAPDVAGPLRIDLADAALGVSANLEREHLIDPRTGRPPPDATLAAAIAPMATAADAWSTALAIGALAPGPVGSILWSPLGWTVDADSLGGRASVAPLEHPRPPEHA
ncbi:MAG: FAD:protein FMN transferase [Phycisphaerales bacterium]